MITRQRRREAKTTFVMRSPRDLQQLVELTFAAGDEAVSGLAARAGLCWQTVRRLVSPSTREPRLTTAIKLLRALGYEVTVRRSGAVEARG